MDIGILLVALFFIREGYRGGFFAISLELFSFLLGLMVALLIYNPLGGYVAQLLSLSRPFAKVLVFLAAWLAVEATTPLFTAHLYMRIPVLWLQSRWNRFLGILPGLIEAALLCSFLLSLTIAFPFPPLLKRVILDSRIGEPLVQAIQLAEVASGGIIGKVGQETLAFMTVGEVDNRSIELGFVADEIFPDPEAERQMFELVNAERVKIGLSSLVLDPALTEIARLHAADMFKRGYFSHLSPEGNNIGNRADAASISYRSIGENLAFTPDAIIAHTGLMKSEQHRRNILSSQFTRVGIGIQNAGANGLMFVQNFAD